MSPPPGRPKVGSLPLGGTARSAKGVAQNGFAPVLPRAGEIGAISLDLDDTLWPVMPALVAAEKAMVQWLRDRAPATAAICSADRMKEIRLLVAMANADRAHDVGWMRLETLRRALAEAGDDPALAVGAFNVFMDGRQRVTLYDDVDEILERWRLHYKLVAVTNGNADIDRIGIGHYFEARVAAHELGVGKPDRRIFQHACDQVGLAPARVLHIGDDLELDVRAARGAGLHAAWIRRVDVFHGEDGRAACGFESSFSDLRELDRALARR